MKAGAIHQGQPSPNNHPGALKAWIAAIRPATLSAGAVPVIVGTALCLGDGVFSLVPALAALVCALLLQVGCNLANDVFDHLKGADTKDRLGPPRAAQQGWLSHRQLAIATAASLLLSAVIGSYLIVLGGWPILAIGLSGLICAIAYTGGPFPLGYLGLGDLLVFVFFGPSAVCGTYFVQAGNLPPSAILASIPVGLLATAILVVNNLRDRKTDKIAGKRTTAVRFGEKAARSQYFLMIAISYLCVICAYLFGIGGLGWLLPLLSLPLAVTAIRAILTLDGSALNAWLGGTARLELIFSLLLSAGVLL